jgi:hypothetical protein
LLSRNVTGTPFNTWSYGGVSGNDVCIIFKTEGRVEIHGVNKHKCTNIDIGSVGGITHTKNGPIIGILHQHVLLNKGSTIHYLCQFEWYKNDVNDKSINVPGSLQCIQTLNGYIIPLSIKDSLSHLGIQPHTDHQWDKLPQVILTSELELDPSLLYHEFKEDEQWGEVTAINTSFDEVGYCRHGVIVQHLA